MFDAATYNRFIEFANLLKFNLLDWEDTFIREVFCNLDENQQRIIKKVYCSMGRGNGKTYFAGFLCLAHLLNVDTKDAGGQGNNIGIAASSRDQAGECFKAICELRRRCQRVQDATHLRESQKEITGLKTGGFAKCMSSDDTQAHGRSFSLLYFDELHTIGSTTANREYYDALIFSATKRANPLIMYTTTAGYRKDGVCWEVYNYAKSVRDHRLEDRTFYPMIFEADEADNLDSEETWMKANPSLGKIKGRLDLEQFKLDLQQAKTSNATLSSFKRQKLNQWTNTLTNYIDLTHWDCCQQRFPDLARKTIHLGVDLASHQDLCALAGIIPHENRYYVFSWAWTTSKAVQHREKQNLMRYEGFINQGELTLEEGDTVNYQLVRDKIKEIATQYRIGSITCDPAGANETAQLLLKDNLPVKNFPQYPSYFNDPLRRLAKLITEGRLVHDGNTLLRWQAGNLSTKEVNGMLRPTKEAPSMKIDSMIALLMSLSQVNDATLIPVQPRVSWF